MKKFDPINSPLDGKNLIEAAAGTGKTYAVTCIFIRLIIERGLPVEGILVVTFTVAATEELKDRIREMLKDAWAAFVGDRCESSFLKGLLEKYSDEDGRKLAVERIIAALRDFDKAAIFTIHGFCQRMLYENAFESGALFDVEMVTSQEDILTGIAQDFWRRHFYQSIPELVEYAIERGFTPAYFRKLLDNNALNPDVKIVPGGEVPDVGAIEGAIRQFKEKFEGLRATWARSRDEVAEKLQGPGLKANVYGNRVPAMLEAMQKLLASDSRGFVLFKDFEKFTEAKIRASMKKGFEPPAHAFFTLCQDAVVAAYAARELVEGYFVHLRADMIRTARREITARKSIKNIMFYDDLLLKMREALLGPAGDALGQAIRRKFRCAIIDEFQDTDTIQYAIFHAIFGKAGADLFLIGDPKQTIFNFRGADVFAYLKAATSVEKKYALGENWRSEPGLIKAVNTLFSSRERAFVHEGIAFQPASAATGGEQRRLDVKGRHGANLQVWIVSGDRFSSAGRTVAKGRARPLICRAVATEIAQLLKAGSAGLACVDKEPIREKDIAVLVRTNREALFIQDALTEMGIPCVLHIKGNIYESREAEEMERLLAGIVDPDREGLVRGAATTSMMGVLGNELDTFTNDEDKWRLLLEKFSRYHEIWKAHGFIRMMREIIARENVKERILRYPDGERRLTNILQLAELLQRESMGKKRGPMALVRWLAKQRASRVPGSEEDQIRLDTDEEAVKVVTVHKSKGLEYPVVFCPFVWGGSDVAGDILFYHDEEEGCRLTCDVGSSESEQSKKNARKEALAENIRLLYVALTRARHRCYLVWGRFNEAGTSAPAYLLHRAPGEFSEGGIDETDQRFCKLSDDEFMEDISGLVKRAGGAIHACEMPIEEVERYGASADEGEGLSCREFQGNIDKTWKIASFSYLASGSHETAELPDRDVGPHADAFVDETAISEASGMFAFPKGARAGSFLHDVMESADYAQKNMYAARDLIAQKLSEYGFEGKWIDAVTEMLAKVVATPLDPENKDLRLSALGIADRINELEFYFPLKNISTGDLRTIYATAGFGGENIGGQSFPEAMERLRFSPAKGFMKGYMDMVFRHDGRFYLVDWKSNFLGGRAEDYNTDALSLAMGESFYFLQYHIYLVALHRYLELRVRDYSYERHFGGVYYLFLRGMDPALGPGYGIYRDRPDRALIERLTDMMLERR